MQRNLWHEERTDDEQSEKAAGGVVGAALVLAIIAAISANQRDGYLEAEKQPQAQAGAGAESATTAEASSGPKTTPSATPSTTTSSTTAPSMTDSPSSIAGQPLIGAEGLPIGQVRSAVRDPESGTKKAVVSVGGFLGVWSKDVTVPVADLTTREEALRADGIDDAEQLYARPAYQG
ncbi:hypothetical protein [Halochromatium sp.]